MKWFRSVKCELHCVCIPSTIITIMLNIIIMISIIIQIIISVIIIIIIMNMVTDQTNQSEHRNLEHRRLEICPW